MHPLMRHDYREMSRTHAAGLYVERVVVVLVNALFQNLKPLFAPFLWDKHPSTTTTIDPLYDKNRRR